MKDTAPASSRRKVLIHFAMSLDGSWAGPNSEMDWMVSGLSNRPGFLESTSKPPGNPGGSYMAWMPSSTRDLLTAAPVVDRFPHRYCWATGSVITTTPAISRSSSNGPATERRRNSTCAIDRRVRSTSNDLPGAAQRHQRRRQEVGRDVSAQDDIRIDRGHRGPHLHQLGQCKPSFRRARYGLRRRYRFHRRRAPERFRARA